MQVVETYDFKTLTHDSCIFIYSTSIPLKMLYNEVFLFSYRQWILPFLETVFHVERQTPHCDVY